MTEPVNDSAAAVEVRPEVVFLYELLEQLTSGSLRIPRFQRPFVWRKDQRRIFSTPSISNTLSAAFSFGRPESRLPL